MFYIYHMYSVTMFLLICFCIFGACFSEGILTQFSCCYKGNYLNDSQIQPYKIIYNLKSHLHCVRICHTLINCNLVVFVPSMKACGLYSELENKLLIGINNKATDVCMLCRSPPICTSEPCDLLYHSDSAKSDNSIQYCACQMENENFCYVLPSKNSDKHTTVSLSSPSNKMTTNGPEPTWKQTGLPTTMQVLTSVTSDYSSSTATTDTSSVTSTVVSSLTLAIPSIKKEWAMTAKTLCQSAQMDIISIESEEVFARILAAIHNCGNSSDSACATSCYWINISRDALASDWKFNETTILTRADYTNWAPNADLGTKWYECHVYMDPSQEFKWNYYALGTDSCMVMCRNRN